MEEQQAVNSGVRLADRHDLRGILKYTVFRGGVPIETIEDHNLIVNGARNQMARLIAGDFTNRHITKISFGTSGTAPTVNDTAITNAFTKNVAGHEYPAMGQVRINWNLLTTEDNGQAILEFGLICADNTLFSRRTRENPIYKAQDISIEGQWTIIF
jgi:hypothetical protein